MYKGIGASAGIGIGKIVKIKEEELNYTKQSIEDTEAEKKRLSDAIEVFIEKTQKMVESMKVTAGEQEAEILEGHIMMIQDPAISEQIEAYPMRSRRSSRFKKTSFLPKCSAISRSFP